jgi:hypothetical protein
VLAILISQGKQRKITRNFKKSNKAPKNHTSFRTLGEAVDDRKNFGNFFTPGESRKILPEKIGTVMAYLNILILRRFDETIKLMEKLLENLCNAREDNISDFRSISRSKPRFQMTLFANEHSKSMMQIIGFINTEDGRAHNKLSQSDIKFIKADLSFAYSEYIKSKMKS